MIKWDIKPHLTGLITIVIVSIGIVAWTWRAVHVRLGFALGCAVLSIFLAFLEPWFTGVRGFLIMGGALAVLQILRRAFYAEAGVLSAATFQTMALFVLTLVLAGALRVGFLVLRKRRVGNAPT